MYQHSSNKKYNHHNYYFMTKTCFVIVAESITNRIPLEPGPYLQFHNKSRKHARMKYIFHLDDNETNDNKTKNNETNDNKTDNNETNHSKINDSKINVNETNVNETNVNKSNNDEINDNETNENKITNDSR